MARSSNGRRILQIESMEHRRVLAAVGLANGVLSVQGDSTSDRIYVSTQDGVTAVASVADYTTGVVKAAGNFNLANITSANIQCNGGNDNVEYYLEQPAVIDGGYGNDTIYGGFGSDSLIGGEGDDRLYGEGGHDTLLGGGGNDLLKGSIGIDSLFGDAGLDTLYGGTGNDSLSGGDGHDLLYGEGDNDSLNGDAGNDTVYGGAGLDTLWGGIGYDYLFGGADNDRLYTDALDQAYGDEGTDWFDGVTERFRSGNPNSIVYRDWGRF